MTTDSHLQRLRAQNRERLPAPVVTTAPKVADAIPTPRGMPIEPPPPPPPEYADWEIDNRLTSAGFPPKLMAAKPERLTFTIPVPKRHRHGLYSNVYLCGPNGTGKSCGAFLLAREWMQYAHRPEAVKFVKAIDIPRAVTDREEWEFETTVLQQFKTPSLLVIDDLDEVCGKDYGNPKLQWVREVLDARLDHYKATIVTGNRDVIAWGEVDTAIQSRLMACQIIEVTGPDQRAA